MYVDFLQLKTKVKKQTWFCIKIIKVYFIL